MDSSKKRVATSNKSISQQELDKALIKAVEQRNTHDAQSCLEKGANPNQLIFKQPLITHAIRNSNIKIAELLIKHKVNLEAVDSKGNTPLLFAVQSEQIAMIKFLLGHHANIDAQNLLGLTSVMYAAQKDLVRLTKLLCLRNPNVELKNNENKTALELAEKSNDQIVQAIKACESNNNTPKQETKTPALAPKKDTKNAEANKKQTKQEMVKKKSKKEKAGPLNRLLTGFSQGYAEKYPPSSSEWSLKKKNQHAQEAYMSGVLPELKDTWFFHTLNHQDVPGDTGTNAFLPPESVEKIAKKFELKDFEAYVHYQPKQKLADRVEAIYKHLGYLPEDYKIDVEHASETATEKKLSSDYVMTYGHGTTEVFDTFLEHNTKNKRDSIIVCTPTYGLFIPLMRNHCKIKTLPTTSENSGAIDPTALKTLIDNTEKENIDYYKDYFSPMYALLDLAKAKIKEKSDFEAFSKQLNTINNILKEKNYTTILKNIDKLTAAIENFNKLVCQLKKEKKVSAAFKDSWLLEPVPRVRALYFVNPSMPSGKLGTQASIDKIAKVLDKHPSINVLEDVTHRGIILKKDATVGSFTKTSIVDRTLVLDGISKIFGLARARASILIGHRSLITPIAHSLHMRNCTLNGASHKFLSGIYKLTPEQFKDHLTDLSKDYQKRLNLLKAVLFGQGDFSQKEFNKIKQNFYAGYEEVNGRKKLTEPQKQLMFSGVDDLKLYCEPEAGYFVLIDLSAYVGKYLGSVEMRTGMDFRNAFYNLADVNSLSDVMCYDDPEKDKAYIRYSLSIDSEIDMVEGLLRMKKVLAQCKPTAMEIAAPKEKSAHSSPCKKGNRKKADKIDKLEDHKTISDILDKPARTLTFLKDTKPMKVSSPKKEVKARGEKRRSPRFLVDATK